MSLSFADIDSQHVELLPARTVMSLFATQVPGTGSNINVSNNSLCGISVGSVGVGVGVLGLGVGNVLPGVSCGSPLPALGL
ncbi:MAG: hypothetical protein M3325_00550 [Actinomycetota bacterium]|nr:hypothetical protein [Actinomycetota bacterium]